MRLPHCFLDCFCQAILVTTFLAFMLIGSQTNSLAQELFQATPLTKAKEFTTGIEGPACDKLGNIYAVNFARQQTIGKVSPEGNASVFVTLPGDSTGNGIVFDPAGNMFIADYVGHHVLRIASGSTIVERFASDDTMNQPNDLAIAPDGTLYASDPNWKENTGQLWKISKSGQSMRIARDMGTTNGIEVSPDGKWLYVNESVQKNIWKFPILSDGTVGEKKLIRKFEDFSMDGMRCDASGNLYVTRHGKGTILVMTTDGQTLREIAVLGSMPSNICFGGPDGKTVYVTEVEHTRLVQFRVDTPGLAWTRWKQSP